MVVLESLQPIKIISWKLDLFFSLSEGKAVLEYEKTSANVMDFYHTGVPTTHRGQGIAKHLVEVIFLSKDCYSFESS